MKKILTISILSVFLAGMMLPAIGNAVTGPSSTCTMTHTPVDATCASTTGGVTTGTGICCLVESILNITDWVFYVLMVIVVIMFIWGGAYYVTAAGDPEKAKKGQEIVVAAIIGLIIAFVSKMIGPVVKFILGV